MPKRDPNLPPPLPWAPTWWKLHLQYVLRTYRDGGQLDSLPHQWTTALDEPRCVRCGEKLLAAEIAAAVSYEDMVRIGSCARCRAVVLAEIEDAG